MNNLIKILFALIVMIFGILFIMITIWSYNNQAGFYYKKVFAEDINLSPQELDYQILKVVDCESNWYKATGTAGEIGIAQYIPSTFQELRQKAGMEHLDINENKDQLELLYWSVSNGYGKLWSCF